MNPGRRPRRRAIVARIEKDAFAARIGARIDVLEPGFCRASMTVGDDMINFHGMTHGGVVFSLADVALAAASNSRGQTALALNVTIAFLRATHPGDRLVAEAREQQLGGPTGLYDVSVTLAGSGEAVARLQATIYRKREWFADPPSRPRRIVKRG